jgi:hypothetical protein
MVPVLDNDLVEAVQPVLGEVFRQADPAVGGALSKFLADSLPALVNFWQFQVGNDFWTGLT